MGGAQLHRMDGELHPGLLGQCKAVRQAGVVRAEAQQARYQCAVGAVAPARGGKTAIKPDVRLCGDVSQQLLGRVADAGRARRMAGGGADHHRPENVEKTHEMYTSFRFAAFWALFSAPQTRPGLPQLTKEQIFFLFIIPLLSLLCYNNFIML